MKKRVLAWILTLALTLSLLPVGALATGETVTVSVETKTINGQYLAEPTKMTLEEGDTPITLVTRLAQAQGLTVENPTGTYIVKIGDFGGGTHGSESGWMMALNGDRDTYPMLALKDGDTLRAYFTYKTYGFDVDLLDYVDELRETAALAEAKLGENGGNPFFEPDGYLEDENSKFNLLSAAYGEVSVKLEEVDGFADNRAYLDSLGTLIYGNGSETETVRELTRVLAAAIIAETYVKANGANITVVGNPTKHLVGSTYQFAAEILPANATDRTFTWELSPITGEGTIDQSGALTITKAGMIQVRVNHADTQVGYSLEQKLITAVEPTPAESLDMALEAVATKNMANLPDWWWAVGMSDYATYKPDTAYKATAEVKQAFVNTVVADVVKNQTDSNKLANAITGLSALGYDPSKIEAADGKKYNAVELLKAVDWDKTMSGDWVYYYGIAPYVLLALQQGEYGTTEIEENIIQFLLDRADAGGGWSTTYGVETTGMIMQGLASYYATDDGVKEALDKALTMLSNVQNETTGGFGDPSKDAMVILGLTAMGIDPNQDMRFIKDGKSVVNDLLSKYSDGSFGNGVYGSQGFLAAVAAAELLAGETSYNAFDFTGFDKAPAVATPGGGGDDSGGDNPIPPAGEKMNISFTLETHNATWISKHTAAVPEDGTVGDAFRTVLDGKMDFSYVDNNGYISAITRNGTTLAESSQGPNSGWKYRVNNIAPSVPMNEYTLSPGDDLVWYYVTDYTQDTDRDEGSFTKPTPGPEVSGKGEDAVVELNPSTSADKKGQATAQITEKELAAALTAAQKGEAKTLVLAPKIKGTATAITVELPAASVETMGKVDLPLRVETGLASLTLAPQALADFWEKTGKTVSITAKEGADGAIVLELKTGDKRVETLAGGLRVALPAKGATPGTVLMLVDEEGNQTVLRKSVLLDGAMTVLLEGSATVKLVDNAQEFSDLGQGHWAANAVAFASSRELLRGTETGAFDPEASMTRASLMTLLHRLDGVQTEEAPQGQPWYTPAQTWAMERGLSDGSNPEGEMSRQELALLLFRYAEGEAPQAAPTAPDAGEIAPWAADAMGWAVEVGILAGDQNGRLNPQAPASRAQVAAILERFLAVQMQ